MTWGSAWTPSAHGDTGSGGRGYPGCSTDPARVAHRCPGYQDQLLIVATVTGQTPEVDAQWTHRGIAEHLHEPVGISASQIGRVLASFDVKPHRVRGWLNRPADPAFHTTAQAVCALYLDLPADTVLFSVDEKTCMQARSRKRRTRPVRPGQAERREFEYVRHGTVSLMAAMNVTAGTVHQKIITRNDSTPSSSSSSSWRRPSTRPRRST